MALNRGHSRHEMQGQEMSIPYEYATWDVTNRYQQKGPTDED